jgi:REP element-mobilizing transposase RayT
MGKLAPPEDGKVRWYSRGYLPHLDGRDVTQGVTFRLADSLPQTLVNEVHAELKSANLTGLREQLERIRRLEVYLDRGYGSCVLRKAGAADIVASALRFFDGQRYELHAYVVMPNHVHALFTPKGGFGSAQIVHSWKSFTSNKVNELLGRRGTLWMPESFDRYIRSPKHFAWTANYIEFNPVSAGLCKLPEDWRWSSAKATEGW